MVPTVTFWYLRGLADVLSGGVNLESDALKMMLVNNTYSGSYQDTVVDASVGSGDLKHAEIAATGYARGWGGAGRKTVTTPTVATDPTNKLVKLIFGNVPFGNLGGAVNEGIAGAVLIKEGGANDTTSRPLAFFPVVVSGGTDPVTTNGGPFTMTMDAVNGNLSLVLGGV